LDNEQVDLGATTSMGSPVPQPRLYTDEEVNRIVASKLNKRQEAAHQDGSQAQIDINALKQQLKAELANDLRQESDNRAQEVAAAEWREILNAYNGRLQRAAQSGEIEDFDAKMRSFNHAAYNEVIYGAMQHDNTAEIMLEIRENPEKGVVLKNLAQNDPAGFTVAMAKLSKSIAANKAAKERGKSEREPLSQVKPNTVGADNGKLTVKDYKKMFCK